MERVKYNINGKTYYSPMRGGWGYLLIDGEYRQTKDLWFPIICDCPKEMPMQICDEHGTIHR